MWGVFFLVGTEPVGATVIMSFVKEAPSGEVVSDSSTDNARYQTTTFESTLITSVNNTLNCSKLNKINKIKDCLYFSPIDG